MTRGLKKYKIILSMHFLTLFENNNHLGENCRYGVLNIKIYIIHPRLSSTIRNNKCSIPIEINKYLTSKYLQDLVFIVFEVLPSN